MNCMQLFLFFSFFSVLKILGRKRPLKGSTPSSIDFLRSVDNN